jgi:hypothetical protein
MILTCVFSCLFLVMNSILVSSLFVWVFQFKMGFLTNPRIQQLIVFCLPVLMVFAEWWVIDMLVRRLTKREPNEQ